MKQRKRSSDTLKKILVVDDEKEIADLVELYLKNDGFEVISLYHASEVLDILAQDEIALAILDVMLPDMDGFTLCRKIRESYLFPIIMLTAKVEDIDKITGLTVGADDYITKPFNPLELTARVKTQIRRYTRYNNPEKIPAKSQKEIAIRGLLISKDDHQALLNEKKLSLTPIEFEILWYLCEKRGNVVSSEELFEAVWGEKYDNNNNTIMTHIARLREKMQEPARKPKYIKTIWGVGYTIEAK